MFGQIELGDRDAVEVPQWETGEEPVVANQTSLCVATRPDIEGEVRLTVFAGEEAVGLGHEIYTGELTLPSGVMTVGSSIAAQLEEVDLSPARSVVIRVFIEPQVSPSIVNILLPPRT